MVSGEDPGSLQGMLQGVRSCDVTLWKFCLPPPSFQPPPPFYFLYSIHAAAEISCARKSCLLVCQCLRNAPAPGPRSDPRPPQAAGNEIVSQSTLSLKNS